MVCLLFCDFPNTPPARENPAHPPPYQGANHHHRPPINPLARVFALLREPGEGLAGVPGGLGEGGAAGDAAGGGQGLGARRAAEKKIGRKINPTLYKPAELRRKRAERNSFIVRVLQQPKIFVIGSDGELE